MSYVMRDELEKRLSEIINRIEALEKSVNELKAIPRVVTKFSSEDIFFIAQQFSYVLKSLADAGSKLAERNIGYESRFSAKDGVLTVQLFKVEG